MQNEAASWGWSCPPVAGQRERDLHNGAHELVSGNLVQMLPFIPQVLARPRWLLDMMRDGGLMQFPNVVIPGEGPLPYEDVGAALERSTVSWDDMGWIRRLWGGPIVIKGVLSSEDARRAIDAGAEAIVVSNHGGRAEESGRATIECLPEVVDAVQGKVPVLVDGGFRRGSDIFKALALGAKAICIGRPYTWGLAAFGQAGVEKVLDLLTREFELMMKHVGATSLAKVNRSFIVDSRTQ